MRTNLKRTLVGTALALCLVGGGAVAFAQTQQTPPQNGLQSFLDDVASHLGVTPAALQSAIQAAQTDRLNQALKSGKITQQQYNNMQSRIQSGKPGWFGMGPRFGHRFAGPRLFLKPAADYLGLQPQDLMTKLRGGMSLAQIASATPGKSVQGLEAAMLAPMQQRLSQAVSSGKITQQQANTRLQNLQTRLGQMINRTFHAPGAAGTSGKPA